MFGLFVATIPTGAQDKKLTMSGIVTDSRSHQPVEGATVSVVGNKANPYTTDREGNFILTFSASTREGEVVRLRVEKTGYEVYEVNKPVSPTIPVRVLIDRITLSIGARAGHAKQLEIRFADTEPYRVERKPYVSYRVGIFNGTDSVADNVTLALVSVAPQPRDPAFVSDFPYPLFTSTGEQHVRINPHDEVLFSLARSWLASDGRIIVDEINNKTWRQSYREISIQHDETWHLTLRVTGANNSPTQVELQMVAGYDTAWVLPAKWAGVEDATLLLDCETQALPIKFGPGSPVYILDTQTLNGLEQFFITEKGTESLWPSPDSFGDFAYRCELTNYSDDPLFAISITFTVNSRETIKNEQGTWTGTPKITSSHEHHVEVPKVEGHASKFKFYVWIGKGEFVTVTPPVYAEVALAKSAERTLVLLKQPSSYGPLPMNLSPRKELLK